MTLQPPARHRVAWESVTFCRHCTVDAFGIAGGMVFGRYPVCSGREWGGLALGQAGVVAKLEDSFRKMLASVGALYRADAALLWLLLGIVVCTWLFVFMADLVT